MRLAESAGQLILHHQADAVDTYLVNDNGTVYRYQIKLPLVTWGEWTETNVAATRRPRRRGRPSLAERRSGGRTPRATIAGVTDLRRLQYFLAVARERNFTRAAEQLHVAQPALSRQVRLLEEELGVELLHRTTHSFELTEAGAFLLERGPAVLAARRRAVARRAHLRQRGPRERGHRLRGQRQLRDRAQAARSAGRRTTPGCRSRPR